MLSLKPKDTFFFFLFWMKIPFFVHVRGRVPSNFMNNDSQNELQVGLNKHVLKYITPLLPQPSV